MQWMEQGRKNVLVRYGQCDGTRKNNKRGKYEARAAATRANGCAHTSRESERTEAQAISVRTSRCERQRQWRAEVRGAGAVKRGPTGSDTNFGNAQNERH